MYGPSYSTSIHTDHRSSCYNPTMKYYSFSKWHMHWWMHSRTYMHGNYCRKVKHWRNRVIQTKNQLKTAIDLLMSGSVNRAENTGVTGRWYWMQLHSYDMSCDKNSQRLVTVSFFQLHWALSVRKPHQVIYIINIISIYRSLSITRTTWFIQTFLLLEPWKINFVIFVFK